MQGNMPFSTKQTICTIFAILPLAADGFCSYMGFWESNQFLRILTGSLAGTVFPALLLFAGNFEPAGKNEIRLYENTKELLVLLFFSVAWGICLWDDIPVYKISAIFSISGEICLWAGVFWLLLRNLFHKKQVHFWGIAFLLAFGMLFLIGGLI